MRADEQEPDEAWVPDERASNREVHIHQGHWRIFGGCALKVVELTSGDLPTVRVSGLRRAEAILISRQKSAESVVRAGQHADQEG